MGGAGGRHEPIQPVFVRGGRGGQADGDTQLGAALAGYWTERTGAPGGATLGDLGFDPEGEPHRFGEALAGAADRRLGAFGVRDIALAS